MSSLRHRIPALLVTLTCASASSPAWAQSAPTATETAERGEAEDGGPIAASALTPVEHAALERAARATRNTGIVLTLGAPIVAVLAATAGYAGYSALFASEGAGHPQALQATIATTIVVGTTLLITGACLWGLGQERLDLLARRGLTPTLAPVFDANRPVGAVAGVSLLY